MAPIQHPPNSCHTNIWLSLLLEVEQKLFQKVLTLNMILDRNVAQYCWKNVKIVLT